MKSMHRRILVAALAAASIAPVAAIAQDTAASAAKTPAADAAFAKEASAGGLAEVTLGQLAASKGNTEAVKSFGQRMVTDHGKANDELKAIAEKKGLTLATSPKPADEQKAKSFGAMSGDAFDQAYAKDMVKDHKKDIAAFSKEATSGKDPELKAFAQKTLPILKEHLQMAEQLPGAKPGSQSMAGH